MTQRNKLTNAERTCMHKKGVAMNLAVKTSEIAGVKLQLLSLLKLEAEDVIAAPTKYSGITLLNLNDRAIFTLNSIRNVDALLLDEFAAIELLQSTTAREASSFNSLGVVDALEQYEHLS